MLQLKFLCSLVSSAMLAGCVSYGSGVDPVHRSNSPALTAELREIVEDAAHPLASLSVLAIRDGRVAYEAQFGRKFIDNADVSRSRFADPDTLYRIASLSKLVTTLGVMRLVEAGKLDLDAEVIDALGFQFRNPHFPATKITLRMLLSHTSSLRDDAGYYWEAKLGVHLREVLLPDGKYFGAGLMWDKTHAPGTYFQYNNLAWGVIGTVMERATNERFDQLMDRLVLKPLALRGGFHPADFDVATLRDTATLYRKRTEIDGKEVWQPLGPWIAQVDDYSSSPPTPRARSDYIVGSNGTLFGPQGNCRLSAADLGKVMLMLMNRGRVDGVNFLSEASIDAMLAPVWVYDANAKNGNNSATPLAPQYNAWGLGVQHFTDRSAASQGDRLVASGGFVATGHLGDAWGLTAAFVFDPVRKDGMIFLIGGPGFNPETYRGEYSSLYRHEEKILDAMYRHALRGPAQ
jgi:CubicO group peptidase (beta-lactamase class C family)